MIDNFEDWKSEYKKDKSRVWTRVSLSNRKEYFFKEYSEWFDIKGEIELSDSLKIDSIKLQYRSNLVDIPLPDCDGVYFIRSVLGRPGASSIDTLTVGRVCGNEVNKDIWILPSLVCKESYVDSIENCFEEAIIKWK